jgi:hypothetical protein
VLRIGKHGIEPYTIKIIFGNKKRSFHPIGGYYFVFRIRGLHPLLYPNGLLVLNLEDDRI